MVHFSIISGAEKNISKNKYTVLSLILMGFTVHGFNNINRFEDA